MDEETAQLVYAARQQLKACQRAERTLGQILAQLDEKLADHAKPEGGHSNGKAARTPHPVSARHS